MIRLAKRIAKKLGIDKAISYVLIGRGLSLFAQPVTLYFIGKKLTPQEQGFYFTFSNLIALSILLELGLGTILTQFASHEYANLEWEDGQMHGNQIAISRFLSLGKKTFKWYSIICFIFSCFLIPYGIYFFKQESFSINYVLPWILLVIFSSVNLIIYAFTSLLEGCNRVADIQFMKMLQSLIGNIFIWILLLNHGGLYASSFFAIVQTLIALSWLYFKFKPLLIQIFKFDLTSSLSQISWRREIFPVQWKIGLSWFSGYFITQAINPLLFKFRGSVEAGQMGMTISIASIASVFGLAWLNTKIPTYGSLINSGKISELSKLAKKNTVMTVIVTIVFSFCILIGASVVKRYYPTYGNRFLSLGALFFLLLNNIINIFISSIASFLRAFKDEPFLINSLIVGLITGCSIYIGAKYFNAQAIALANLAITFFVSLPMAWIIMKIYLKRFNINNEI